ncbi:MAG: T9SS type A sorting domain-containing protein [bacterium]|nr:T9SS type A sorting domain-containing protein [bacterium]
MVTGDRFCQFMILAFILTSMTLAGNSAATTVGNLSGAHIPFIQNVGQVDSEVRFYAQTFSGTVFVTDQNEIVYALPNRSLQHTGLALKEFFVNGKANSLAGEMASPTKVSYFHDQDRDGWKSNIPSYEYVTLGEVFDNIDVKLRAYGDNVEKLFFVRTSGDPSDIALGFEGARSLSITGQGELAIETDLGTCTFTRPIAYQDVAGERAYVEVAYHLSDSGYGFSLGDYDVNETLVIDPLLSSTFVGGNGQDEAYEPTIVIDNDGNVFFTGETNSANFPTTAGAYDTGLYGSTDRVVCKFDSDLTTLLASTYIGGNGIESGMAICITDNNDVLIAGYTGSANFPVTPGAYDRYYNGGELDSFIARFDNDLTTLIASTFFGGSNTDGSYSPRIDMGIGVDGNVYIAGLTSSSNLPMNASSCDRVYNGDQDFFVAKFTPDLTTLLASTFVGGGTDEWRPSIQIDGSGDVFVSGTTRFGYPTTVGAYDRTFNGGNYDMVITKLSADLSEMLASTYLGTSGEDNLKGIRVDAEGNVYTAGMTSGSSYPTTAGAYDRTYNGSMDMCVSKLSNDLSTLIASTFIGGSRTDDGEDVFIDAYGNVHVIGLTNSADFPVTDDAYDSVFNGSPTNGAEVGFAIMSNDLSTLHYATYMGRGGDLGKCVVVNDAGDTYLCGITYFSNFPTTPGCYDSSFNGGTTDCFIAKFGGIVTGLDHEDVPHGFKLNGNYPNPFNPTTNISYSVPRDSDVALSIHDLQGRIVAELVSGFHQSGDYTVRWDGRNGAGVLVASGIYSCRLQAGDYADNRKMSFIK